MINNILVEVLSSIAEQERMIIRKRQREGIDAAKKKRKHLGRPSLKMPEEFSRIYTIWKRGEITAKLAMQELELSSSSFYRMVKQYESDSKG